MMQNSILTSPVQALCPHIKFAGSPDQPDGNAAAEPGSRPHERLLGKRILIVEDEALLAFEIQLAFEDEGAEVLGPALTLIKALEVVTHEREIDFAVLDVDVAGEDVYPIAELLLQRGVPFIFHTGHGSRAQLTQLFPSALTLMKPTRPEELIGLAQQMGR